MAYRNPGGGTSKDPQPPATLTANGHRAPELYRIFRDGIIRGDLPAGKRLVEREMAKAYGVSRTPVREAIHRLEMDGLVEMTTRGAAVVHIGADELSELCTVREALEGLAASLAASAASELDISALRALNEANEAAVTSGDIGRQVELNHAFHETVWNAARNRYLVRQLRLIRDLIERRGSTTLQITERQHESLKEHTAITWAIGERDPVAAETAAREHFRRAMLLRLLQNRTGIHLDSGPSLRLSTDDGIAFQRVEPKSFSLHTSS